MYKRHVQIYATKTKDSKAAADKLFNEYIMQFGYPERIHHDRGPEFNSRLFEQMHRVTRIRASNTTPYHPMGDGQVERFNRTICNMLRSLSANAKKDWRSYLPKLAFAYNATVNKATGYSPHFLMFGREARLPIDMVFEEVRSEGELDNKSHEQFVKQWTERMQEAMEIARKSIEKSANYNKQYYDRKVRAVEIGVGDMVLVKNVRERGVQEK